MRKILYKLMNKNILTFDSTIKDDVLDIFDKKVDKYGYIIEKDNPSKRVLTPEGEEIEVGQFAGVKKGSEIYLKSDILSLINLYDSLE